MTLIFINVPNTVRIISQANIFMRKSSKTSWVGRCVLKLYTLVTKALRFSETSGSTRSTIQRHIPREWDLHSVSHHLITLFQTCQEES